MMNSKHVKRRTLTPQERNLIYRKCHGRCAYCGIPLKPEEMQVDHVVPMAFYQRYKDAGYDLDSMDNYLPACRSCNRYKHTLTVDKFSDFVSRLPDVLYKNNVSYRNAVRFGLVVPQNRKAIFYYQSNGIRVESLKWELSLDED